MERDATAPVTAPLFGLGGLVVLVVRRGNLKCWWRPPQSWWMSEVWGSGATRPDLGAGSVDRRARHVDLVGQADLVLPVESA